MLAILAHDCLDGEDGEKTLYDLSRMKDEKHEGELLDGANHFNIGPINMNIRAWKVAAVAIFLGILTQAFAQQIVNAKKPLETQVLERFIGSWDETVELKPALLTPDASTIKTTTTRKWILNGKMVENKGSWSPSDVEFLHLMTYDPEKLEFCQWYFDASTPAARGASRGLWDEATQTLTLTGSMGDEVTSTLKQHFIDKDNFTWTMVAKDNGGAVLLDMEGKVKRKLR